MLTRFAVAAVVAAGVVLAGASGASAHVTIAEGEAQAGSYTVLTFGVPHGCGESATTEVRIQIPESMPQVTPTVNPSWSVAKVMVELDEPVEAGHGQMITERVAEVVYSTDDPLPADLRDAFELSVRIPDDAAGTVLYFPTVQICEEGETAWIEIPAEGQSPFELDEPSPFINVVAGHGGGHGDDESEDGTAADEVALQQPGAASGTGTDDGGVSALSVVALLVGIAGLGAGGAALWRTRSAS